MSETVTAPSQAMATVNLNITRGNGINLNATAQVPDEMVMEMAGMIGAMIFDASVAMPSLE